MRKGTRGVSAHNSARGNGRFEGRGKSLEKGGAVLKQHSSRKRNSCGRNTPQQGTAGGSWRKTGKVKRRPSNQEKKYRGELRFSEPKKVSTFRGERTTKGVRWLLTPRKKNASYSPAENGDLAIAAPPKEEQTNKCLTGPKKTRRPHQIP